MPETNYPDGITSRGVSVLAGDDYGTTGSVFFVHSDGGGLGTSISPFSTIDYAIGRCTANNGDVIRVMEGHTETITAAAGIACDVAGISIIGMGNGTNRPTINFTTATTADLDIDAANVRIENIYFDLTGIDAVAAAIDVNAANFTMKNCDFLMADGTGQAVIAILTAAAAASSNMKILGCSFLAPDAGATSAIEITGTPDNVEIGWCNINGDFSDACIQNPTGNVATNLSIHDNVLKNDQTGDHCIQLVSACTGSLVKNMYHNDMAQGTAADTGACFSFENYHCDAVDVSGILAPAAT